ncbi:MAG TPA: hypothetical protein PLX23_02470 [Candidatus Hydrogenedens sp.]|nr:hypothetical protein [Candidatus Hydrogenedens sp.]
MKSLFYTLLLFLYQTQLIPLETIDYLDTNEFVNGFVLTTSRPVDKPNILGVLTLCPNKQTNNKPTWQLAQWGTQFLLTPGSFNQVNETTWTIKNQAKQITIQEENQDWGISLNCNGIVEYQGRLRKYGEPWPHLLIEKNFDEGIKILGNNIYFNIEFRITNCSCDPTLKDKLDPTLHTAQITAYWTVRNANSKSKDFNEYFWFGIPLFDARCPIPPEYINVDKGSTYTTNKLIAVIDGKRFYDHNTGDGDWKKLNILLNPLFEEALNKGKAQNFLKDSNIEDLVLSSFNLGWEITGPYNAEIQIKHLSHLCGANIKKIF